MYIKRLIPMYNCQLCNSIKVTTPDHFITYLSKQKTSNHDHYDYSIQINLLLCDNCKSELSINIEKLWDASIHNFKNKLNKWKSNYIRLKELERRQLTLPGV